MTVIKLDVPAGVDAETARLVFERMLDRQGRIARVSSALAKESAALGAGVLAQVGRIDRAWRAVEATYGLHTAGQVAALTGSPARSARSHAHNLRRRKGLLAVRRGGALAYPGFQFTTGNVVAVRPGWRDLTTPLLAAGWAEDEVLLWFASPTGLLSGLVPADLLDEDTDRVGRAVAEAAAGNQG